MSFIKTKEQARQQFNLVEEFKENGII